MKQIPLTQGKIAFVDDEDYERINKFKWQAIKEHSTEKWYAVHSVWDKDKKRAIQIKMHRLILGLVFGDGVIADHADNDGLNNQKKNLRSCNHKQNMSNRRKKRNSHSEYLGVNKSNNGWVAQISHNNEDIYLGYFSNEGDAAKAYNLRAKEIHGEFANLNNV